MINAIEQNLVRGIKLLCVLSDEQYSDCTIPPYYSSIGNHMRHILDMFSCVFKGLSTGKVDFSDRTRNELAQRKTEEGILYFNDVIRKLKMINPSDFDTIIKVTDNLGQGMITLNYTLSSALAQVHSHTIHHYATIGFLVHALKVELLDADFGYNPTTPR